MVYKFDWCVHHGCLNCYDDSDYNQLVGMSFGRIRANSLTKQNKIKLNVAQFVVIKECKQKKIDPYHVIEENDWLSELVPLNMRDALYGGRTLPMCLYRDIYSS